MGEWPAERGADQTECLELSACASRGGEKCSHDRRLFFGCSPPRWLPCEIVAGDNYAGCCRCHHVGAMTDIGSVAHPLAVQNCESATTAIVSRA